MNHSYLVGSFRIYKTVKMKKGSSQFGFGLLQCSDLLTSPMGPGSGRLRCVLVRFLSTPGFAPSFWRSPLLEPKLWQVGKLIPAPASRELSGPVCNTSASTPVFSTFQWQSRIHTKCLVLQGLQKCFHNHSFSAWNNYAVIYKSGNMCGGYPIDLKSHRSKWKGGPQTLVLWPFSSLCLSRSQVNTVIKTHFHVHLLKWNQHRSCPENTQVWMSN